MARVPRRSENNRLRSSSSSRCGFWRLLIAFALNALLGCTYWMISWNNGDPLFIVPPLSLATMSSEEESVPVPTRRAFISKAGPPPDAVCMETGDSKHRVRPLPSDTDRCLLWEPPNLHLQLLMNVLVGLANAGRCNFSNPGCQPPYLPYDEKMRRFGDDWPPHGFTMVGVERLHNLYAAISEVNRNNVVGAIMEFGVWRGGAMMLAQAITTTTTTTTTTSSSSNTQRDVYLFDAFGAFGGYGEHDSFLGVSLENVQNHFRMLNLNPDDPKLHFVKGMFQDTTVAWVDRTDPIAVLRVDGNFYDSYQDVMYAVYQNVPVGGIVIFDDVYHPSHTNVMQFWLDFKQDHGLVEELVRIDRSSAWFRKRKDVVVDQSKRRKSPTS